ncbi:putative F-actin-capping protein subunit beta-like [Capsicum annuum]|nr:putative F-actin-capping protein subunit beta-like [Capsicum annuum]
MTEYLCEIRNVADELAMAGTPIPDDELAVKILSGLGPEYDSISAYQRRNRHTPTNPLPTPTPDPSPSIPSQNHRQSSTTASAHSQQRSIHRSVTRSQNNITKPKQAFDYLTVALTEPLPTTYNQAQRSAHWKEAMKLEFEALMNNKTYKARLVAKGFTQQPSVDYNSTFSPLVKPVTVRLILSLAVQHNWHLHQLDVNNAFLQGHLEEDIYMRQPRGYAHPDFHHYVCKLKKAIYGLKQAPRAWYSELKQFLLQIGFQKSNSDSSLFICHQNEALVYILVYVDDIIITGSNSEAKYVSDLLAAYKMSECKPVTTLMSSTASLSLKDDTPPADATLYRQVLELHVQLPDPPIIYCDNVGATYLCQNPILHSRMKHIEVDFHFVRDQVQQKQVLVQHLHAVDQLPDTLTKPLPRLLFHQHLSKLKLCTIICGSSLAEIAAPFFLPIYCLLSASCSRSKKFTLSAIIWSCIVLESASLIPYLGSFKLSGLFLMMDSVQLGAQYCYYGGADSLLSYLCQVSYFIRHPIVKWAQRSDKLFITVELPDAKNVKQKLEPEGKFFFSATAGADNVPFEADLHLFDKIDVDESKSSVTSRSICYLVKKAEDKWWARLVKQEGKPPTFLKADWDKWVDEDEQDGARK